MMSLVVWATRVLVASALVVALAPAPPTRAATTFITGTGNDFTITGPHGQATAGILLPPNAVPQRLTTTVRSTYTLPGSIILTVNDRVMAKVPASRDARLRVPLRPGDARAGLVTVGFRVQLDSDDECIDTGASSASLLNPRIVYRLVGGGPTSVAGYLSPGAREVIVTTSVRPVVSEQQAALNAIAVAQRVFGPQARVVYAPDVPRPAQPAAQRVIRISRGGDRPQVVVRGGVLTVSGPPDSLTTSVLSLASEYVSVAGERVAVSPSASFEDRFGDLSQTLGDLGLEPPPLTGIGDVELNLGIDQVAFGRPVAGFALELRGAVTPVLGGTGRINVLWNDTLVSSTAMTENSAFAASATIGSELVERANTLTLQMQYAPKGGCRRGELPARFDLDDQSVVTASAGQTLSGFQSMPQQLGQVTPVALTGAAPVPQTLAQAAGVIAGWQRLTPRLLRTELLGFEQFAGDSRPGLAVGVTPAQDAILRTPLRYAPFRSVDGQAQRFTAEVAGSFAGLQTYDTGQRQLTVLGATGDAGGRLMSRLGRRANTVAGGWASLSGDIAVAQTGAAITTLSQTSLAVQPEKVADSRVLDSLWLILSFLGVAVAVVVGLIVRRRKRDDHG
ncbi:MAG: hypothetical protein V9E98_04205 [Candidatus Nanopelagicales bacterium]